MGAGLRRGLQRAGEPQQGALEVSSRTPSEETGGGWDAVGVCGSTSPLSPGTKDRLLYSRCQVTCSAGAPLPVVIRASARKERPLN